MQKFYIFFLIVPILFFASCSGPSVAPISRPDSNDVIYSFGDTQITIGDLLLTFQETREFSEFELHLKKGSEQPTDNPMSSSNISSVTQYLQSIAQEIAFEYALAQKATELKLDQEESFQHSMEDSLRDEFYQKVIIEDVLKKIKITESDIKKYYQQHREGLFLKDNTNVYKVIGIYVYLNQAGRSPEQAHNKIKEAYQKLEAGESFASVSKQYSEAPANMRGIVNPLPIGSAAGPIEEHLKKLSEGKYSPIFEYKNRLYIFELVEYIGAEYLDYDTVHDSIMLQLFDELRNERVYEFSQRLQKKHNCLVNEGLLKDIGAEDQDAIIMTVPGAFEITLGKFLRLSINNQKWTHKQKTDYLQFLANKASCLAEAYDRGWTEKDVEAQISVWRRKRLAESYIRHEAEAKLPPESTIKSVYEKNYGDPKLCTPKYYDLSYLFFDAAFNFALTSFEKSIRFQNAEGKALAARHELELGRPFTEIAIFYANDEESVSTAGRIGRVPFDKMNARLQTIVEPLESGEISQHQVISDIESNRYGIEIYYVNSIGPSRPYTFEEAKPVLTTGFIGNQMKDISETKENEFINSNNILPNRNSIQNVIRYLSQLMENPDRQVDITYYAQKKKTTEK